MFLTVKKLNHQTIAVYAEGPIIYGEGSTEVIGSGKLVRTLKSIGKKDNIKAVVIRVNSPGGSAFASELIWEEIEELKKNKTVVVSMGNVAASGGYYISAGADEMSLCQQLLPALLKFLEHYQILIK